MNNKSKIKSPVDLINKQDMFAVPENYFQDLPGRIFEKLETKISGEVKMISTWERIKPALLVAAAVIGFMIITYAGQKLLRTEKESNLISSLDAIEYIDYYSQEFGEELLLENIDMVLFADDSKINETDEIIEYLILEGIDELKLYNEL